MNKKIKTNGFTIIEVVLVLAIAALIFLMIFVALPALQRGQRDTARKSEAGQIASAVTTYRSNNQGALPAAGSNWSGLKNYLSLNQITNGKVVAYANRGSAPTDDDSAEVVLVATCSGGQPSPGTQTQAAVWIYVENGDSYCQPAG
jgi:prepilin-type N-terminal cleavage/methylation domain-containing protein